MARDVVPGIKAGLKELKNRLFFVLLGIIVYRFGAYIPVPGIDPLKLAQFFNSQSNSIFGLFNMFSEFLANNWRILMNPSHNCCMS